MKIKTIFIVLRVFHHKNSGHQTLFLEWKFLILARQHIYIEILDSMNVWMYVLNICIAHTDGKLSEIVLGEIQMDMHQTVDIGGSRDTQVSNHVTFSPHNMFWLPWGY